MISAILNFLTYAVLLFLLAALIIAVIAFCLAVTYIQVNEKKEASNEQEASAPECGSAAPAAQRKRRRIIKGYAT